MNQHVRTWARPSGSGDRQLRDGFTATDFAYSTSSADARRAHSSVRGVRRALHLLASR